MPYQSYLFKEIHEQPQVLETMLACEKPVIQALAEEVIAKQIRHVLIAARGTSDNAGRYAKYLFGAANAMPVALAAPSLYTVFGQTPDVGDSLVIGISQSGKSPDIVSVLDDAREQGAVTAAITNVPDSDLANASEHVISLHAGEEKSIAATKTYTSELLAVALMSAMMARDDSALAEIEAVPDAAAKTLEIESHVAEVAQRYRYMRDCVVIGRGYNYASAFELALKLKELTYTIAEPYSSADFMHGPLALIEYGFPAIVVAPSGRMLPEMADFVRLLRERDAEPIVISDDQDLLDLARIPLPIRQPLPEWLSPLTAIIPGQLFAMHLAKARDYNPDHPRGLRKVTETR